MAPNQYTPARSGWIVTRPLQTPVNRSTGAGPHKPRPPVRDQNTPTWLLGATRFSGCRPVLRSGSPTWNPCGSGHRLAGKTKNGRMVERIGPMGSVEELPIDRLLPSASQHVRDQLREIGRGLELSVADGRPSWYGYPGHLPPSEIPPRTFFAILGVSIGYHNRRNDDWLDLSLEIGWRRPRLLSVEFDIGVACWCEDDHGTHYVVDCRETVGDDDQLVHTFERLAAELVARWRSGPHEAKAVRARVGLTNP